MTRVQRLIGALCVVLLAVGLVPASVASADTVETAQVPWLSSSGSFAFAGECNLAMGTTLGVINIASGPQDATLEYFACNGFVPDGEKVDSLSGAFLTTGGLEHFWNGTAWSNVSGVIGSNEFADPDGVDSAAGTFSGSATACESGGDGAMWDSSVTGSTGQGCASSLADVPAGADWIEQNQEVTYGSPVTAGTGTYAGTYDPVSIAGWVALPQYDGAAHAMVDLADGYCGPKGSFDTGVIGSEYASGTGDDSAVSMFVNQPETFSSTTPLFEYATGWLQTDEILCTGYTEDNRALSHVSYPSNVFNGATPPASNAPCVETATTGPTSEQLVKQSFTFSWSGPADEIAVDPGNSSDTYATVVDGDTDSAFEVSTSAVIRSVSGDSTIGLSVTPTVTSGYDVFCYYDGQGYRWLMPGTFDSGATTTGTAGLSSCFSFSGMSLTDPISWVTGLWTDGVCVLQYLFVPTGFDYSTLYTPFTTTVPGVWLADGISGVEGLTTALQTADSASVCSAPSIGGADFFDFDHYHSTSSDIITLPEPQDLGCPNTTENHDAGNLFGYRSLIREVEVFLVYVGGIAIGWRMMPWARGGDGSDLIDRGGGGAGLDKDGNYYETYTI